MNANVSVAMQRKKEAIAALPARLSFISKVSKEPKWKNKLSNTVTNTYQSLHHFTNQNKLSLAHFDSLEINPKMREKSELQISEMDSDRMSDKTELFRFSHSPLPYFPVLYDPSDIRTQPSYVKAHFDYHWKPGVNVPIPAQSHSQSGLSGDSHSHGSDYGVYGKDYSQIQLSKIVGIESVAGHSGGAIGSTQDLQQKLAKEEEDSLTQQQKLDRERSKKTAEARAANSLRLERIRQKKEKIRESIKDWERGLKKRETKEESGADTMADTESLKRIERFELLDKPLPKMEQLLTDTALNKEFFELRLPLILELDETDGFDSEKREECVLLMKKYVTLQSHVGYMQA